MNIFILDTNPTRAAEMLCDKHISSQMNESLQMLSTVVRWKYPNDDLDDCIYKEAHPNHPCTLWAGTSYENWSWLLRHGQEIWRQYQLRYGSKPRKFDPVLAYLRAYQIKMIDAEWDESAQTPFVLVMPDAYKGEDPVEAYRGFYAGEKDFAEWRNGAPKWWLKSIRS